MIAAWTVFAWPAALWQASRVHELALVQAGAWIFEADDATGHAAGQTLWADSATEPSIGIAWDWVQLRPGVIALADPLGLVSNLGLQDDQNVALGTATLTVQLNRVVRELPWQAGVLAALENHRAQAAAMAGAGSQAG
jgi:hypothetical protein